MVKNSFAKKTPDLDSFISEQYQTFKKEIISIFHKLFQKTE